MRNSYVRGLHFEKLNGKRAKKERELNRENKKIFIGGVSFMKKTYEKPVVELVALENDVLGLSILNWQDDPWGFDFTTEGRDL